MRESAEALSALLRQGKSVGLLGEGDPFFYGSFMHIWRRLDKVFPIEVVPGVTGMSGCWTRANTPITWGNDILSVLPGTMGEEQLTRRLADTDAAVIMKVGSHLAKDPPRRDGGRPAVARDLCRARHHARASRSCPCPKGLMSAALIFRWC